MKKPIKHRKAKIVLITIVGLFIAFLCIPVPRFDKPYSTVLTANGVSQPPTTIPQNTSPASWNMRTVGFSSILASTLSRS